MPEGITGFSESPPMKSTRPWEALRKSLIQSIYDCGEKVIEEISCDGKSTPNFHIVETSRYTVIVHDSFRYIACVGNEEPFDCGLDFIDWAELQHTVERHGAWRYLTAEFLELAVTTSLLANLNEAELSQVAYWKPETVGHVIFNHWD